MSFQLLKSRQSRACVVVEPIWARGKDGKRKTGYPYVASIAKRSVDCSDWWVIGVNPDIQLGKYTIPRS